MVRIQALKSWPEWADDLLLPAAGSRACLDEAREAVEAGRAGLLQVSGGMGGLVVMRMEAMPDGSTEAVFWLGAGRGLVAALPYLVDYARRHGADTCRAHVQRPGLKRMYERAGWRLREYVMEC